MNHDNCVWKTLHSSNVDMVKTCRCRPGCLGERNKLIRRITTPDSVSSWVVDWEIVLLLMSSYKLDPFKAGNKRIVQILYACCPRLRRGGQLVKWTRWMDGELDRDTCGEVCPLRVAWRSSLPQPSQVKGITNNLSKMPA